MKHPQDPSTAAPRLSVPGRRVLRDVPPAVREWRGVDERLDERLGVQTPAFEDAGDYLLGGGAHVVAHEARGAEASTRCADEGDADRWDGDGGLEVNEMSFTGGPNVN